ncbi:MAG: DUF2279 domain-containing protein [Bacteroidota bacterium]
MPKSLFFCLVLLSLCTSSTLLKAQQELAFLENADSLHKGRVWTSASILTGLYTGAMIGLNELWYADFPRSSFHTFNDMGEWEDMDKIGHFFSAYAENQLVFHGARWAGIKRRKAMWIGAGVATIIQGSIEVLDGFSEEWGFSFGDIAFNTAGCALFVGQELAWQEQRIILKYSAHYIDYPEQAVASEDGASSVLLKDRARDLYGGSFSQTFLKDYNSQTIWASVNIHSFLKNKSSRFPKWLNLAIGYGAENMYGGFSNSWESEGLQYNLDPMTYPRYRQFYLSPDIDLNRIPIKNRFLRLLVNLVNLVKIPAPSLEINTNGGIKFHAIHF